MSSETPRRGRSRPEDPEDAVVPTSRPSVAALTAPPGSRLGDSEWEWGRGLARPAPWPDAPAQRGTAPGRTVGSVLLPRRTCSGWAVGEPHRDQTPIPARVEPDTFRLSRRCRKLDLTVTKEGRRLSRSGQARAAGSHLSRIASARLSCTAGQERSGAFISKGRPCLLPAAIPSPPHRHDGGVRSEGGRGMGAWPADPIDRHARVRGIGSGWPNASGEMVEGLAAVGRAARIAALRFDP